MTLEDKIALCSGADFWQTKAYEKYGIPSVFLCDGPHGLRKQENAADMLGVNRSRPATCFPAEVTTSGSWDPELTYRIGKAIAEEAREQNVDLVLGPGANSKRNPLCGRNFEYFSEDPVLAGKLAAGFIRGAEEQGVGTSLKHFAANSQEYRRFTSDSVMDERTLQELYLAAFETAVREGRPSTVMCAYPKLNGVHCSDHRELLTEILRDEWGFEGAVVTDWGAMNDRIEGFRAGCDLNMPGGSAYMEREVLEAVRGGRLPESAVDESAARVLRLAFRAAETREKAYACDYDAHHELAREAACEGAVLLKNEGGLLPLKRSAGIAVLGHMAKELRYQGAGSSHINATRVSQPLDFLPGAVYAEGVDARGDTTDEMLREAAEAAGSAEAAVVFAGLPDRYESEGFDRSDMKLPEGHVRLIEAVAEANPDTVVVLLCGAPVECPWADRVRAILYMGLPGQAGGEAAADLLLGRANPSGKLAETWPMRYEDCVSAPYYGRTADALYLEGLYTGYRYYDKAGKTVRWPFGFGLSYTDFACSDLRLEGGDVSVTVTNTGGRAGAEVVQLFIEAPQDGIHRPLRQLRRFCRVELQPGESRTVGFRLTDRDFAVWQDGWKVPGGTYRICVGGLSVSVEKAGMDVDVPAWQAGSWYERCGGEPGRQDWEAALGRPYMAAVPKKGEYTMDNTVTEMKDHSLIMKILYKAVENTIAKGLGGKKDDEDPEFRMLMAATVDGPLRSMMISGGMNNGVLPGMLEMANGHFLRGIWRMIRG